jgi:hypothetical protein
MAGAPDREKPQRAVVRSLVEFVRDPEQPVRAWALVPHVGHRRVLERELATFFAGFGGCAEFGGS